MLSQHTDEVLAENLSLKTELHNLKLEMEKRMTTEATDVLTKENVSFKEEIISLKKKNRLLLKTANKCKVMELIAL